MAHGHSPVPCSPRREGISKSKEAGEWIRVDSIRTRSGLQRVSSIWTGHASRGTMQSRSPSFLGKGNSEREKAKTKPTTTKERLPATNTHARRVVVALRRERVYRSNGTARVVHSWQRAPRPFADKRSCCTRRRSNDRSLGTTRKQPHGLESNQNTNKPNQTHRTITFYIPLAFREPPTTTSSGTLRQPQITSFFGFDQPDASARRILPAHVCVPLVWKRSRHRTLVAVHRARSPIRTEHPIRRGPAVPRRW